MPCMHLLVRYNPCTEESSVEKRPLTFRQPKSPFFATVKMLIFLNVYLNVGYVYKGVTKSNRC